jgi:hypothetical protein
MLSPKSKIRGQSTFFAKFGVRAHFRAISLWHVFNLALSLAPGVAPRQAMQLLTQFSGVIATKSALTPNYQEKVL